MLPAHLQAVVAAAAALSPHSTATMARTPGRLLRVDGDGLCYYCAGKDDVVSAGEARANLIDKVRGAAAAAGAESVEIVTTSSGSHKGYRYAVARVKPYQGQRTDNRRPKNWAFLREFIEAGVFPDGWTARFTSIAEADDLFGQPHPDCVIYTQDKDMRMIEGWHLDWLTHLLHRVTDQFNQFHNDKRWGRGWFWAQLLQGDTADNIPGLPYFIDGSIVKSGPKAGTLKQNPCGEVGAEKLLANLSSDAGCCIHIGVAYESCYGDRWLVEMLEQGILLWMRRDLLSDPFDVCAKGHPFHHLTNHSLYPAARQEIEQRIAEAKQYEQAQSIGDSLTATPDVEPARTEVQPVFTAPAVHEVGARPRPLDGDHPSGTALGLQQPAGQGGEQPPPVRSPKPLRLPAWHKRLLAAA